MTDAELDEIESVLEISLPSAYRVVMLRFPVPALVGNDDSYLWDDPARLIEENRRLRNGAPGGVQAWPKRFYCLGRAGGGDVYAIDLEHPAAPVWWVDHSHLEAPSSGQVHASFEEWLQQFVRDTIQDLEGDGFDPNGSPEELESALAASARQDAACLLWVVGVGLLLAAVAGMLG